MARIWLPQILAVFTFFAFMTDTLAHDILQSPSVYDWGFYGLYPRTWFKSYGLAAPRLNFLKWEEQCTDGFYLLSPRGSYVSVPGPVIMDGRGNMVWRTDDRFGDADGITDFKVQIYNGKPHLTFWAGANGAHHRFGYGVYYVLDETYQIVKIVKAVETRGHSLRADLHEFHITPENTGLISVYYPQAIDLSPVGGPVDGWVLDSIFQEVDLDTGDLIFEWRASDHIPIEMTMRSFVGSDLGDSPDTGFDYFHINSVDKDHLGNYIISARHTHTVICISPQGETLWILGGKQNMFKDLSDGRATDFSWQHHARWHGTNTLSLFDNAKSTNGGHKFMGDHSRGMMLELDTEAMTAKLLHDYYDPKHPKLSESQGSMQVMDSGKVLVDYGFFPAFTEFSPEGEVICDVRLAPWLIWQVGMVTSYRGFKTDRWVGKPWYAPEVSLRPSEGVIYVSWNGATEVDRWVLQGADWDGVSQEVYEDLDIQTKDGFEMGFDISDDYPQYVRVTALDKNGDILKHTIVMDRYVGNAKSSGAHGFLVTMCVMIVLMIVAIIFRKNLYGVWRRGFPQRTVAGVRGVFASVRRRSAEWRRSGGKSEYNELQNYED
ncbi:hypothetical protein VP1G_00882 [Cytospora mali]|uniref:ASST-domain-containing protein n=1 Tax=Cytospora mali TaxID=578113 RepID=A0A194UPJ5_CYTMA|nr:hypothetical protein VP1G_00882 [Valsa mali var. pyri (nom. inval.)]